MKKIKVYFLWGLGILALLFLDLTWQSVAPYWLNRLSWPLVFLSLFAWLRGAKSLWWPALVFGLLADLASFSFFPWQTFIWSLLAWILHFLSLNFFSSRSAYSFLLLSIFLTFIYYFCFSLFSYFLFFQPEFLLGEAWYWRTIILSVIFNFFGLFLLFSFFRRRPRHLDLS